MILQEGEEVRPQVDVLIASLHWGDEFIDQPSPEQIRVGRAMIDGGFDVVIGHHPHILQGVEEHDGGVIAYSLGNFVYDQWQPRLRQSAILSLCISGPRSISFELEPVTINELHQPTILSGELARDGRRHLAELAGKVGRLDEKAYGAEVAVNFRRFRREMYIHYMTRLWRKSPTAFAHNISEIVRRRL